MDEVIKEKIVIAPNVEAQVTYTHIGPAPAPNSGFDWPEEADWPRVRVRLTLPCDDMGGALAGYLVNHEVHLLGQLLDSLWGQSISEGGKLYRYRGEIHSAPTVRLAYERCKVEIADALQILQIGIDRRNLRLEVRNRFIAAGRVDSPFKHKD